MRVDAGSIVVRIEINHDLSWRDRLGSFIGGIANRIDGRGPHRIRIRSSADISQEEVTECVMAAWKFAADEILEIARERRIETVMRHCLPDLYRDRK